ncbi:MAG TPA: TIGR01459 family HAD-type hydrolase, partial [Stellaceae bacterium]|nr:TIGR01459 family HAD-type hydrolase [Stellaceae bacterium]
SSGEETWQHLHRRDDPFYAALGPRCWHIGPARDDNMLAGIDFRRVSRIEDADFILNTGPGEIEDTLETFEPVLEVARARHLPMICANPDLVVMHEGQRMICAGLIAERYEALGGRVRWHGKPFPSVYGEAFALLNLGRYPRILAVGDSLRTDIAGANGVGIAGLLVAGGIHGEEFGLSTGGVPDPKLVAEAVAASGEIPTAVISHFVW